MAINACFLFLTKLLDCGHVYLQQYCVSEIIFMVFLAGMFNEQTQFIYNNYASLSEWQMAAILPFPLATWAMMKDVWSSINIEYKK